MSRSRIRFLHPTKIAVVDSTVDGNHKQNYYEENFDSVEQSDGSTELYLMDTSSLDYNKVVSEETLLRRLHDSIARGDVGRSRQIVSHDVSILGKVSYFNIFVDFTILHARWMELRMTCHHCVPPVGSS